MTRYFALAAAIAVLVAVGVAPRASAATSAAPYQSVQVFQSYAGQLRKVPSSSVPHTYLLRPAVRNGMFVSSNWSGYADQACGRCHLRYVYSDFTLPRLDCASSPDGSWVAYWVGLDGLADSTVEQDGLDAYCSGGTDNYFAWYEMYPAPTQAYSLQAGPGDNIQLSVYYNPTQTAKPPVWNLTLTDTTSGAGFAATATCQPGAACLNKSAEVVTEAPAVCATSSCSTAPLADFGRVNFSAARVTSYNGAHGGLGTTSLWTSHPVTMEGLHRNALTVEARPGSLISGRYDGLPVSDFSDYWLSAS